MSGKMTEKTDEEERDKCLGVFLVNAGDAEWEKGDEEKKRREAKFVPSL